MLDPEAVLTQGKLFFWQCEIHRRVLPAVVQIVATANYRCAAYYAVQLVRVQPKVFSLILSPPYMTMQQISVPRANNVFR